MKVSIVGLGLIGGSLAIELRTKQLASLILGVDSKPEHAQQALELQLVDKIIQLDEAIQISDLIILATPVDVTCKLLPQILSKISTNQTVTDVGSIKGDMLLIAEQYANRGRFVAAHPMAGTEFSGPTAAQASLFEGKACIICNPDETDNDALQLVRGIFRKSGMHIIYMDAWRHDVHVAYVSHISHITSFALGLTVLEKEKDEKHIFELASGGFTSTVRLANSAASMWTPILIRNKESVLEVIRTYSDKLKAFENAIETGNSEALNSLIQEANRVHVILKQKKQQPQWIIN